MTGSYKQLILNFTEHNTFLVDIDADYLGLIIIEALRNLLSDYDYVTKMGVPTTYEAEIQKLQHQSDVLTLSVDYVTSIYSDEASRLTIEAGEVEEDLGDLEEIHEVQGRVIGEITDLAISLAQCNTDDMLTSMYPLLWDGTVPLFPSFTARFIRDKICMMLVDGQSPVSIPSNLLPQG